MSLPRPHCVNVSRMPFQLNFEQTSGPISRGTAAPRFVTMGNLPTLPPGQRILEKLQRFATQKPSGWLDESALVRAIPYQSARFRKIPRPAFR
jgi:hypothetical protein